jgi:hypothetical protein
MGVPRRDRPWPWRWAAALLALLPAVPASAQVDLQGQTATVEWRVAEVGPDPLEGTRLPDKVTRTFTVGSGEAVSDLGFYPSLSLAATAEALVFSFSEGWCCLTARKDMMVGPVVTFTSLPEEEDLQVSIGEGSIPLSPADVLVSGNRIAIDLRGRDISGGRMTLLVKPESNPVERVTLGLIGLGLIALGALRRHWLI